MRLDLLVEQETPEAVVEHLAGGILQLIPVITAVDVRKYDLPKQKVCTPEKVGAAAQREIRHMRKDANWRVNEGPMIILKGIDVMVMPPLPSVGLDPQLYYNLPQLLTSAERDGEIMLVGTHERWFSYHARYDEKTSQAWPESLAANGRNDGVWGMWSWEHKGGIVSLAKECMQRNVLRAAHELGHGLNLGHHNNCIMQVGATYTRQNQIKFCEPCKNVVIGVVAK